MLKAVNGAKRKQIQPRSVHVVPVVLDEDLTVSTEAGMSRSILNLPLATGTVLTRVLGELAEHRFAGALVVTSQPARFAQQTSGNGRSFRVLSTEELAGEMASWETSDYVLIIRPRYWPGSGHAFQTLVESSTRFRGASHSVAVAPSRSVAREQIVRGSDGQVSRINRLYDVMNWPESAASMIICSLVPAHVLGSENLCNLSGLRQGLAARGVLTQDIPVLTEVCDLSEPAGILALGERTLGPEIREPSQDGYMLRGQELLAGRRCRIHPSVQLAGPVILQHGAVVEENARIVGPALLGEGARIGRGATVVGSILGAGAIVAPGAAVMQQVVLANGANGAHGASAASQRVAKENAFTWRASGQHQAQLRSATNPIRWRTVQLGIKRGVDILGAAFGLALLSPLLLLVALLVKLTSPGPVFFAHRREGKDGIEFPCVKFRSMVANAHLMQRELYDQNEVDGPQFKLEFDPRETWLGRWMRRTNIDELPQLFNVLVGQMSLVGPRPSPFRENQICVSWRQARLSVRPGMTGLWQLCRDKRADSDFHQWIYYDLAYVRNFSLRLDFMILLRTVLTLGGRWQVPLSAVIPTETEGD
jgi:lipopolysaccharide/colanic/teichoic acid biosynthesis glycosyltransferase